MSSWIINFSKLVRIIKVIIPIKIMSNYEELDQRAEQTIEEILNGDRNIFNQLGLDYNYPENPEAQNKIRQYVYKIANLSKSYPNENN
jgi:deoxyxylulose-5-phosphate synthase